MKSHKKLFSFVLVFALILSTVVLFNGCGGESAKEMFNKASKNMEKAKSVKIKDAKLSAKMNLGEQKQEYNVDMNIHYIKSKTDDPRDFQLAGDLALSGIGQSKKLAFYIKDQMAYTDDNLKKEKAKLELKKEDIEKALKFRGDTKIDDYVKKDEKDEDKVKLTIDGKKYLKDVFKKLGETTSQKQPQFATLEKQIDQMGIDEIELEATIKNDNFTSFKYTIPMEMNPPGMQAGSKKAKIDITVDLKEISIDSDEEISFPDFKDFKEKTKTPTVNKMNTGF